MIEQEVPMLSGLLVMAGIVLLMIVVNNRRRPSPWEGDGTGGNASTWGYGGDSGGDCGVDGGGGGCDGGGGGGGGD